MDALSQNQQIGKWRLDKFLGDGGQGVVWKVRYVDDLHSPPGAIKICTDTSTKALARFQREIELLKQEEGHPGVVRVRDDGVHEQRPYYVMELASGSLERVVTGDTAGTRLVRESGGLLLLFLRQACGALAHLHARAILHRDIKPSNVLLMLDPPEPMRAVLSDLGAAALEDAQGRLTATHEVVGTPAYRAPESLMGAHVRASDVYSFGKTIEFIFRGGLPSGMGPAKCSRSGMFTDELWDALDTVMERACAYSAEDRFADARELLAAMPETVVSHSSGGPARPKGSATTLSPEEMIALAGVIAECPGKDDWTTAQVLQKRLRLAPYQRSLALRRLVGLDFVVNEHSVDRDGDRYSTFQPTHWGVSWAHAHSPDVAAALKSIPVEPEAVSGKANAQDDDIPF